MKQLLLSVFAITVFAGCTHFGNKSQQEPAYDAELTNYNYPREVQYFTFNDQRQDLRMAYVVAEPEKANGKTVLLLHGKNFSAAYWEPTIQFLISKGFRVVAPDQIGFGKSTKPKAYQFSFHTLAKNTKALLESIKIGQVTVVGHSMGGMLATRFALMYPAQTEKLVLVNPIGLEDYKTLVTYRSINEHYENELKTTPDSIRQYQKAVYFDGAWKPEYEPLIDILSGWTRHKDYPRVAWSAALTTDMIMTQPVLYEFPLLKTPTLLIIGQRDTTALGKAWASEDVKKKMGNYPQLGRRTAKVIPNSKLIEIPRVGHMPQVEAFDVYSHNLLEFIKP